MIEHADKCSPPHIFSEGDLVYYGNDPEPSLVVRIGYDSYINEVRVRRLNEPTTFSAGRWVNHARLHVLEIGDIVIATNQVQVATVDGFLIPVGTACRFAGLDKDDDVLLDVHTATGHSGLLVLFEDFRWFSLE